MDFYQTCEACLGRFLSPRRAVRFCPPCRETIKTKVEELESLLALMDQSPQPDVKERARETFWDTLTCHEHPGPLPFPETHNQECGWYGNINRTRTDDDNTRQWTIYLEEWTIALLKHQLRHKLPGRFPVSQKFTPNWERELRNWEKQNLIDVLHSEEQVTIIIHDMLRTLAGGTREQPRTPGETLPAFLPCTRSQPNR